ncbi:hypothetical protein HYFRA_00009651 [Hymenoscyphus fraxineus]|uniref:Uncharacterized protein n=1 Tax=Hymenoscyphus fraxineus TaxID=746836 RepID=A0A9N9KSY7_9HELO|nr:hypothetical protein HYFRA_00009651 [Hymenoscyphus fraxineus]
MLRGRGMLHPKQRSMRVQREQTPKRRDRGVTSNKSAKDTRKRRSAATEYSVYPKSAYTQISEALPVDQVVQKPYRSEYALMECQTPGDENRKEELQLEKVIGTTVTAEGNDYSTLKMNRHIENHHHDLTGIRKDIQRESWHYDEELNSEDLVTTTETGAAPAKDVMQRMSFEPQELRPENNLGREPRNTEREEQEIADGVGYELSGDVFESEVGMASPKSKMINDSPRSVAEFEIHPEKPPSPRSLIHLQQTQRGRTISNSFQGGLLETFLNQDDLSEDGDNSSLSKTNNKLQSARVGVFRLREECRRTRDELRRKERAKIAADEAFIKFVRENLQIQALSNKYHDALAPVFSQLDQHFTAMQKARDEYGPLDDKYNALFDNLDDKEFNMARIEGQVNRQNPTGASVESHQVSNKARSASPDSLVDMSWETQYHPLHCKYLSRLGDLELALEEHEIMELDLDNFIYQDSKAHSNGPSNPELEAIMKNLPAQRAELQGRIAIIEAEVEDLRVKCLAEGIDLQPRTISTVASEKSIEELPFSDENHLDVPSEISISQKNMSHDSHSMFHLLSPHPGDGRGKDKLFRELITEFDEDNKSDRINRWLLHGLRTSPLALDLLVQIFLGVANILDLSKWQTDPFQWERSVLSEWERDAANIPADAFNLAVTRNSLSHTSERFSARRRSDLNSRKDKDMIYPILPPRPWKSEPSRLGTDMGISAGSLQKGSI